MTPPELYHLSNVTKCYSGTTVLRVNEIRIAAGDCLCLLGPTGAGKSTLLRLMAGIDSASTGQIKCDGQTVGGGGLPDEIRRDVTLVFQRPLLLNGTVRANVEYGLRLRNRHRTRQIVDATLDLFRLSDLAHQTSRTLSGGEIQMVALARAFVLEPKILLLDEPTSQLDPARVALVEESVRTIIKQGTTVIWATHNLPQARRVASRVAFLLDGQLVEVASTEEFFQAPSDPRSADFVQGKMVY